MTIMKHKILPVLLVVTIVVGGLLLLMRLWPENPTEDGATDTDTAPRTIVAVPATALTEVNITNPAVGQVVSSPLQITGQAIGPWFFEGSFPVTLRNWDGVIITEYYATATGDWMTEDFVPFTVDLSFVSPYHVGDPAYMQTGTLQLRRDNPSGLPEYDAMIEIPVSFAPVE